MIKNIKQILLKEFSFDSFQFNQKLNEYTNTKLGGKANIVFWPKTIQEIQKIINIINEYKIKFIILGNASNVIISDNDFEGIVIITTKLNKVEKKENTICVQTGAMIIDVAKYSQVNELSGLEWAAGIPGTIGGAAYMNAGAYGGQMEQVVDSIQVLMPSGDIKKFEKHELKFGYRYNIIQDIKGIILSVSFNMKKRNKLDIYNDMEHFNELRAQKQPLEYPSCGSVFKRPEGHFAGKLIMDSKLQGYTIGGAQVSKKHAGFIINLGNATSLDYIMLIEHIQNKVFKHYSIKLQTEVKIIN